VSGFKARGHSCDLIEMWTVMDQGTDEDHNRFTLSWDIGQEQHNGKGRRLPMTSPPLRPETIEKLAKSVPMRLVHSRGHLCVWLDREVLDRHRDRRLIGER
jgi:hypothetical protein